VYNVPHISEELESFLPKDTIFDGELYVHGSSLESTISLVKKYKPESINLEYHVYDAPLVMGAENLPFKERYLTYVALIVVHTETYKTNPKVIGVLSKITKTGEEQETCFGENLEAGYEGSILRNPESTYVWKHRSKDLLKVKQFVDEEFEVIGYKEGIGRMKGAIIFTCKNNTNPDQTFDVLPKTTIENRAKMFENGDSYIGRKYTVKFFDRTDNGLPRDPIGLAFREDI
jgi:DNA ligase-1